MDAANQITRRQALACAAAMAGLGAARAWGFRLSANDKANIAFIGIGNYGAQNLTQLASENIVAVCDVDWRSASQLPGRFTQASEVAAQHPKAKRFDDWRVMLEQMDKSIDAVVVCGADHMHAQAALTAMKMGKHTYCEKPLAATMEEVRAMKASARAYPKQATQTGIVGHASEDVRLIVEWIRAGAIGTVERVDVYQSDWEAGARYLNAYSDGGHVHDKIDVPFCRQRFETRRDRQVVGLRYSACAAGWKKDTPLPTGGGVFYGSKGVLVYGPVYSSKPGERKQVWLLPEELDGDFVRPSKYIQRPSSHWGEWIDAAKNGKQPSCNWEYGGHITELCLLGNIAIAHHGTVLRFDAKQQKFLGSESANAMFTRPRRKGWELPASA